MQVFIERFKVEALIGVYESERNGTQPLYVSIKTDLKECLATESDDVSDTLDYARLCSDIRDFARQSSYFLIERFAAELMQHLKSKHPLMGRTELKIEKPQAIADADRLGVLWID